MRCTINEGGFEQVEEALYKLVLGKFGLKPIQTRFKPNPTI